MYTVSVTETVRYTYRLRVSRTVESALLNEWHRVRFVWNDCVAQFRDRKPSTNTALCFRLTETRHNNEWLAAGSAVAQQQVIRDFAKTVSRFFAEIRKGRPGNRYGKPKFKSRRKTLPSLNYTSRGFTLRDGKLTLAKGISPRVVWSRQLPSDPSSVRIYQDAVGSWWASFVVDRETETRQRDHDSDIGFDFGIATTAIATDPEFDLEFSSVTAKHARSLRRYQRRMARFKKDNDEKRYKAAKKDAARLHRKARRQRQGRLREYSQKVARNHSRVAVEDLRPGFMARNRSLAKKMHDAAISTLISEMESARRVYGCEFSRINPAYTTMTCSSCGTRTKSRILLNVRTFECSTCGFVCDRDRNAARNVALRAGLNPEPVTLSSNPPPSETDATVVEVRISRLKPGE